MSTRKPTKPIQALSRFMHGIFDFYHDRGMPQDTAKARMLKETYDTCFDFFKSEQQIPDHQLVITLEHSTKMLNKRGSDLSKKLSISKDEAEITKLREALQQIKNAKDSLDGFISSYKGS